MSTLKYDPKNPQHVIGRFDTLKHVIHSLYVSKATDLSDREIKRCMEGRVAELGLINAAKRLRDCGELSLPLVKKMFENEDKPKLIGDLARHFFDDGIPEQYATYLDARFTEMSTVLTKLSIIQSNFADGLSDEQQEVRDVIRNQVKSLVNDIDVINDVEFSNDGRGYCIKLFLKNERFNCLDHSWGVISDMELCDSFNDREEFWHDYIYIPGSHDVELSAGDIYALGSHLRNWPSNKTFDEIIEIIQNSSENHELDELGFDVHSDSDYLSGSSLANKIIEEHKSCSALMNSAAEAANTRIMQSSALVMNITNTENSAFNDVGRNYEISRIMKEASKHIESYRGSKNILDINGNTVGTIELMPQTPTDAVKTGQVRIVIEKAASDYDLAAKLLSDAAERVEGGDVKFLSRSENVCVRFEFVPVPDLSNDNGVDMKAALKSGAIYMADGIEDEQFRFVVVTNGFEPGYHQEQGDAWLVNAKGDCAPGYESPQLVRELCLRDLRRDEIAQLRDVIEGRMDYEEYERQFDESNDVCPE